MVLTIINTECLILATSYIAYLFKRQMACKSIAKQRVVFVDKNNTTRGRLCLVYINYRDKSTVL